MTHPMVPSARSFLISYLKKAGGEGSRGGKILGHTKSGKPIYARAGLRGNEMKANHRYGTFTEQDHRDAADAHRRAHVSKDRPLQQYEHGPRSRQMHNHELAEKLHDHIASAMALGQGKSKEWHEKKAEGHKQAHAILEQNLGLDKQKGNWHDHAVGRLWSQAASLLAQHHQKQAGG